MSESFAAMIAPPLSIWVRRTRRLRQPSFAAANAVGYGLSSSIYTRDLRTAFRYAAESEAGMLHVNIPTLGGEAQVPFGGVKDSGFGDRECGTAAFDFFTELRVVYIGY
jgi:aldehyde dehydrogenase (NAD+)